MLFVYALILTTDRLIEFHKQSAAMLAHLVNVSLLLTDVAGSNPACSAIKENRRNIHKKEIEQFNSKFVI